MDNESPLWERQPWETGAAYQAFKDYYLPEKEPGRLIKAYRTYWKEKQHKTGSKPARKGGSTVHVDSRKEPTAVSGLWNSWARGHTSNNEPIEGSKTWAQRAAAFDAYIAQIELQRLAERRAKSKEARIRTLEGAFSQATIAISQYDLRPKIGPDGKLIVPEIPPFRDIINAIDKISSNLRIEYDDLPKTTVKVENWQDEIVAMLRDGRISAEDVQQAFPALAGELLARAGLTG